MKLIGSFQNYLKGQWENIKAASRGREYNESVFAQMVESRQAMRAQYADAFRPVLDHWKQQSE